MVSVTKFSNNLWFKTAALLLLLLVSCAFPPRLEIDEHLVPAPISQKANTVLATMVRECGRKGTWWKYDRGQGCTTIWATQFGLRAGLRRKRNDVLEIGKSTAEVESDGIFDLYIQALKGNLNYSHPAIYGFPALLISATLEGNRKHMRRFLSLLDRALPRAQGMRPRVHAGLARLLAELYRADPKRYSERLKQAIEFADLIDEKKDPILKAFALISIAKATKEKPDIEIARMAVDAVTPLFDDATENFLWKKDHYHILSMDLTLIDALADMAQITNDPVYYCKAKALLDHLFSTGFHKDGYLMHDWQEGEYKGAWYCSGCNFYALYLVDRIYGDNWVIGKVPPLSKAKPEPEGVLLKLAFTQIENPVEGGPFRIAQGSTTLPLAERLRVHLEEIGLTLTFDLQVHPPNEKYANGYFQFPFGMKVKTKSMTASCDFRDEKVLYEHFGFLVERNPRGTSKAEISDKLYRFSGPGWTKRRYRVKLEFSEPKDERFTVKIAVEDMEK